MVVAATAAALLTLAATSARADNAAWRDIYRPFPGNPQQHQGAYQDQSADGGRGGGGNGQARDERTVLMVSGIIGHGAHREFQAALYSANPDLVVLDGPGGILGEAFLIAEEVRRRGLSTLVAPNQSCASACAIVFLSGRTKYMGKGAAVGLHSASFVDGTADPEATEIMAAYLSQLGVPDSTLRRMARTAPSDIRWLTQGEQKAVGVVPYQE
jgi:membrane-bound ClpP family serine protease